MTRKELSRAAPHWLPLVPDVLTALRLAIALALIPVAGASAYSAAAILLSVAWLTDFLDGRLARALGVIGRLGRWDMTVDTGLGAGLLIGMTGAGVVPVWVALAALVVFGGLYFAGNLAASMLLQLSGYLALVNELWSQRLPLWWLPMATAVAIGTMDWRRLLTFNIPNFVRGVSGRFDRR